MRIEHFTHTGVKPDGTFINGPGAVETNGRVSYSAPNGGCGAGRCQCSPGHWVNVVRPRTEAGVVAGYTAHFDSKAELDAADLGEIECEARRQEQEG